MRRTLFIVVLVIASAQFAFSQQWGLPASWPEPKYEEYESTARYLEMLAERYAREKADSRARKAFIAMRRGSAADRAAYKSFLKLSKSGMFRLFPDKYASPQPTSTFTFRTKQSSFADIQLTDSQIIAPGFFAHSIMVDLGNTPIEPLTLESAGLKFLNEFQPSLNIADAKEKYAKLTAGIDSGGLRYASSFPAAAAGNTYALRVIAYDNDNRLKIKDKSPLSLNLNESWWKAVQKDRRDDITLVFRIIGRDADGVATIVWRELRRQPAPSINFPDRTGFEDFAGNKISATIK